MGDRIRPVRTESDYDQALRVLDILMDAPPDSPESEQLEVLAVLVSDYERRYHPIAPPDPISYIEHVMEARGLSQRDMVPYIGSPARVSEVLGRKRQLTKRMIRALHAGLGLSTDVLLQDYELVRPQQVAA